MSNTYNDRREAARRELRDEDEAPPARTIGIFAGLAFIAFIIFCGYIVAARSLDTPATIAPLPTARPAVATLAPAANPYLDTVGQQAPHVPRSEPTPIPQPVAPAAEPAPAPVVIDAAPAVPLPTIAPPQAAVIGARGSGTCPAGQVFYARTGCHTPGSGGAMPGPVGGQK